MIDYRGSFRKKKKIKKIRNPIIHMSNPHQITKNHQMTWGDLKNTHFKSNDRRKTKRGSERKTLKKDKRKRVWK